jgi:hypothetical protein
MAILEDSDDEQLLAWFLSEVRRLSARVFFSYEQRDKFLTLWLFCTGEQ